MRRLHQGAAHTQIVGMGGEVPIREIGDKAQQRPSQGRIVRARVAALNAGGQCGSHGSGNSSVSSTAREDAGGRRAHHRCSIEGRPWRIDFSRAA